MRASTLALVLLLGAGCTTRLRHPNPLVPPQAMPTVGGTMSALAGVLGTGIGAQMMDPDRSARTRRAGAAVTAAGAGFLGLALIEAIELEAERRKLEMLDAAFRRQMMGSPRLHDGELRPAEPPAPEVPFVVEERSPLSGEP